MIAQSRRPRRSPRPVSLERQGGSPRRLLLDTQAWLWWQSDDLRLGRVARETIATASEVCVSAASAWEIAIKAALGKLHLPASYDIAAELEVDGFHPLPVDLVHARATGALPAHHRDPFDRMLIAQARCEALALMTVDPEIRLYDVELISAGE